MEVSYSLSEIKKRLAQNQLPFEGVTKLAQTFFYFREPACYAATAIHAGSRVRPEMLEFMAVDAKTRYREEDPHTEKFIKDFPIQIIMRDSRFEYDVNRVPEHPVYETVKESWGIRVWNCKLSSELLQQSKAKYDEFHHLMDIVCDYILRYHKFGVVFDIHSYNYQREERKPWFKDSKPDINLGTNAVNRAIFGDVIQDFISDLARAKLDGNYLNVKENDVFKGGYMARRISAKYYDQFLVLALEFKKNFMDEWTGTLNQEAVTLIVNHFQECAKRLIQNPLFQPPL